MLARSLSTMGACVPWGSTFWQHEPRLWCPCRRKFNASGIDLRKQILTKDGFVIDEVSGMFVVGSLLTLIFALVYYLNTSLPSDSTTRTEKSSNMSFSGPARTVARVVKAVEQSEGAGARVRRSIGTPSLRNFSPFLMLDHFRVPKGAGFPDHPHRGQSTITLMLSGAFQHEDFAGHAGTIGPGDLQWMTAGRGIVHAEMPLQESDTIPTGLQLWVDLPAKHKMCEPNYQELKDDAIPRSNPNELVEVKVIAGESYGTTSPVRTVSGVWYLDVRMQATGKLRQPIPAGWNAFLYTLSGSIDVQGTKIDAFNTAVLDQAGEGLEVANVGGDEARFVLIAGEPLDQEVVQYGPFVMDSREGIQQAFMDYQTRSNGFERANWQSKIGAEMR